MSTTSGRGSPLVLHDLTVSHRGHPAVHHLSGRFLSGGLTAVVGPNGAGKSTLLAALAGSRPDHQGRIHRDPALRLAWLPQAAAIERGFPMRVQELVSLGLWHRRGIFGRLRSEDHAGIEQALAAVGLAGCGRRWIGELSAGQLQRVLFARVLLQDAGVILLDEPFNAIDARTTADLLALLPRWRSEGRTVIAVLHDLDQVRAHFDEVLLLAREAIAWGPAGEVLRAEPLFRARQMAEAWDEQAPWCRAA